MFESFRGVEPEQFGDNVKALALTVKAAHGSAGIAEEAFRSEAGRRRIPQISDCMNNMKTTEQINKQINEHRKFWNCEKTASPLVSFRIGNYFFATHYESAKKLLVTGMQITPDMIDVDSFLEDYEKQYNEVSILNQSGFWTAEPNTGIPWMESFWGCEIVANRESFISRPIAKEARDLEKLRFSMDNPWVAKYFEFVKKLNNLSHGRFPVGAPIMRGQGDTAGALMGQTEFIYALYEEPKIIKKTLCKVVDSFLQIYE